MAHPAIPEHQLPGIHTDHAADDDTPVQEFACSRDVEVFEITMDRLQPCLPRPMLIETRMDRVFKIIGIGHDMKHPADMTRPAQGFQPADDGAGLQRGVTMGAAALPVPQVLHGCAFRQRGGGVGVIFNQFESGAVPGKIESPEQKRIAPVPRLSHHILGTARNVKIIQPRGAAHDIGNQVKTQRMQGLCSL
ncbi:hypothetical protein P792_11690 [Asaia sp. SF2.1]|nr:hypothetical protein P792_11690 [Asaia sp. SF2.1]